VPATHCNRREWVVKIEERRQGRTGWVFGLLLKVLVVHYQLCDMCISSCCPFLFILSGWAEHWDQGSLAQCKSQNKQTLPGSKNALAALVNCKRIAGFAIHNSSGSIKYTSVMDNPLASTIPWCVPHDGTDASSGTRVPRHQWLTADQVPMSTCWHNFPLLVSACRDVVVNHVTFVLCDLGTSVRSQVEVIVVVYLMTWTVTLTKLTMTNLMPFSVRQLHCWLSLVVYFVLHHWTA